MIKKLYYVSKKDKPCSICGKPTKERARFFKKNIGYAVCSSLCRCAYNPFVLIDKIEKEMRRNA